MRRPNVAVVRAKPTRKPMPGDLICGECGEVNAAARKFCSRCGSSLVTAVIATKKWWQKFVPRRKKKVLAAGERPWKSGDGNGSPRKKKKLAMVLRPLMRIVSVVVLVGGVLYGTNVFHVRDKVNTEITHVKEWIGRLINPEFAAVHQVTATASSETPDHPGADAVDEFKNTYWVAPAADPQPTLVLTFDGPVDLDRAIIRVGSSDNFSGFNRPKQLHLVFNNGKSADINLNDTADPQTKTISNGHGITSVEIHVVSVYKAFQGTDTAITEIELFKEK